MNPSRLLGVCTWIGVLGFQLMLAAHAQALTITGVMAPDLNVPADGLLYEFTITVSFRYDAGDQLGASSTVRYWDRDGILAIPNLFDDLIDSEPPTAGGLNLPGGPANTTGQVHANLDVGCTAEADPEVFGNEFTGENPMDDGFFEFVDASRPVWGSNTVTCINSDEPFSVDPSDNIKFIPEPSTALLIVTGLLGVGFRRAGRSRPVSRA